MPINNAQKFKELLESKKRDLLTLAESLEKQAFRGGSLGETGELSAVRLHPADIGSLVYDQEFSLDLVAKELRELKEIDAALTRLNREEYGICEGCGKKVSEARLYAIPEARYCMKCQASADIEAEQKRKNQKLVQERMILDSI